MGVGVVMAPLEDVVVLVAGVVVELEAVVVVVEGRLVVELMVVDVDCAGEVEVPDEDIVVLSLAPVVMGTAGPSTETQT